MSARERLHTVPVITPMADEADEIVYPPKAVVDTALVNSVEKYQAMYNESIKDPEGFWVRYACIRLWHA
jgi:hypothetical protein